MKTIGIIPARYESTRFPGKPLVLIGGKPMIQRVYEAAITSQLDEVIVATDDERIEKCVLHFGGKVVLTSPSHPSGTDRCGEAARKLNLAEDVIIVNIQGDEPFITHHEINTLISQFINDRINIATLISRIRDHSEIDNPNKVKVVFDKNLKAIYFSRFAIPFVRNQKTAPPPYFKHIGIYAYRYKTLKELILLEESPLEKSEKLEQLRWIENDYEIYLSESNYEGIGIDTPEDLIQLKEKMNF
ncbi:MAG: 3-deoxy-manno-octulosonate cytidylyltransferase [Bacteroidales bacterium]